MNEADRELPKAWTSMEEAWLTPQPTRGEDALLAALKAQMEAHEAMCAFMGWGRAA